MYLITKDSIYTKYDKPMKIHFELKYICNAVNKNKLKLKNAIYN